MDGLQDPVFIDFFAREQLPAEDTGSGSNEDVPFPGPSRPAPRPTFTDPRASRPGPSTSKKPPALPTPKLAIHKDPRKGLASFPEPERQDAMKEINKENAVLLDQILAQVKALTKKKSNFGSKRARRQFRTLSPIGVFTEERESVRISKNGG